MFHALAPGHLRNMNETLDTGLQLNEGAIVGQVDHLADNAGAGRINLPDQGPGIGRELLETKLHAFLFAVVFQNLHVDLVADVEYF